MKGFQYPVITQHLLRQIVQRMVAVGSPLKIVLFGSRARGNARPDSDLDLLVIEESELPRWERAPQYRIALKDILIDKDIVVRTPAEIDEWKDVPAAFVTTALREGKILYEKAT